MQGKKHYVTRQEGEGGEGLDNTPDYGWGVGGEGCYVKYDVKGGEWWEKGSVYI